VNAAGAFEVKLTPQAAESGGGGGAALARLVIEKKYEGDLEATSRGQMLSFQSAVKGSAGYVAMEEVTGTLQGRRGSFVLQHGGSMAGGLAELDVRVVPDSGTGELTGLAGRLDIVIIGGRHSYVFDYTLRGHG